MSMDITVSKKNAEMKEDLSSMPEDASFGDYQGSAQFDESSVMQ